METPRDNDNNFCCFCAVSDTLALGADTLLVPFDTLETPRMEPVRPMGRSVDLPLRGDGAAGEGLGRLDMAPSGNDGLGVADHVEVVVDM